MNDCEFWLFVAGIWTGGIASMLGMWTHDWRKTAREKRRLIEEAARIQPRDDGTRARRDRLWLHVERSLDAQRRDKDE
jgi:hypothetical protein